MGVSPRVARWRLVRIRLSLLPSPLPPNTLLPWHAELPPRARPCLGISIALRPRPRTDRKRIP